MAVAVEDGRQDPGVAAQPPGRAGADPVAVVEGADAERLAQRIERNGDHDLRPVAAVVGQFAGVEGEPAHLDERVRPTLPGRAPIGAARLAAGGGRSWAWWVAPACGVRRRVWLLAASVVVGTRQARWVSAAAGGGWPLVAVGAGVVRSAAVGSWRRGGSVVGTRGAVGLGGGRAVRWRAVSWRRAVRRLAPSRARLPVRARCTAGCGRPDAGAVTARGCGRPARGHGWRGRGRGAEPDGRPGKRRCAWVAERVEGRPDDGRRLAVEPAVDADGGWAVRGDGEEAVAVGRCLLAPQGLVVGPLGHVGGDVPQDPLAEPAQVVGRKLTA